MEENNKDQTIANQQTPAMQTPHLGKISSNSSKNFFMIFASLFVVIAGVATGWILSGGLKSKADNDGGSVQVVQNKNEAGISDEKTFKDSTQGVLKEGGINGEGTHHLEREGGPSQYVYLTSTVIDLESFVGKKVQVWGQTIKGSKAGWLMDVGKIKVLD
jgi:hypothetical protein